MCYRGIARYDGCTQRNADNFEQQTTNKILVTDESCNDELSKRVDLTSQFFIVARRGFDLFRCLYLWQRESKRTKLDKILRVHFTGEEGIDSSAMAKGFLAKVIIDIGCSIFPNLRIMFRMCISRLAGRLFPWVLLKVVHRHVFYMIVLMTKSRSVI